MTVDSWLIRGWSINNLCFPFKVDSLVSQKWALEGICLGVGSSPHSSPHYKQDRRQELSYRRSWWNSRQDIVNFCCRLTLIKDNIHLEFHSGANIEEIITENWTTTQFREKIYILTLFVNLCWNAESHFKI